jgi:DNA (cytosine-5)-methyltransferase 1
VPHVLLENVPFMLHLAGGKAMDVIAKEFEQLGYAWAYRVVDSRAMGLPQRRRRVYFLASRSIDPRRVLFADEAFEPEPPESEDVACGFYWTEGTRGLGWAVNAIPTLKGGSGLGIPSPPAILFPSGRIGQPDIRDAERLQGFPANWTESATHVRNARWKLVGNAVSVPVAKWLGERLRSPRPMRPMETHPLVARSGWPDAAYNDGAGRVAVNASAWPLAKPAPSLEDYLRYPTKLLSTRATAGFLGRARKSTLRFPNGFISSLQRHLRFQERADADDARV